MGFSSRNDNYDVSYDKCGGVYCAAVDGTSENISENAGAASLAITAPIRLMLRSFEFRPKYEALEQKLVAGLLTIHQTPEREFMLDSPQTVSHRNQRFAVHADDEMQRQADMFAPHIEPEQSVLVYRCGDGVLLETLNGRLAAGIEPDSTRAAAARRKGLDVRASVVEFGRSRKTFDRILFSHPIDQLGNSLQALKALRPLLNDEGLLLVGHTIDSGSMGLPSQRQTSNHLQKILVAAGYVTESISIKRNSYRSAGFQFRASEKAPTDAHKTYWIVKPLLSLVAEARSDEKR